MNRLRKLIHRTAHGLLHSMSRFPLTVFCLACTTILVCYTISLNQTPSLMIEKLIYTFLLGAFLGIAAQFCYERFSGWQNKRLMVYLVAILLVLGYYFILRPLPNINYAVRARTFVAVFATFCIFLWVPSYKGAADFNSIALTHFKSAFTSALYAGVLSLGCVSIIATIDALLFRVSENIYPYTLAVIWIFFATLYYLSLLPRFHSPAEADKEYAAEAASNPQLLKILISYITIPLLSVYSFVMLAYFVKILVTWQWPSGQIGPMILAYSAIGLIVLILASHSEDKFAAIYRLVFPKVLILMVIMQLISVMIRLNAYGITESRYYLALFGIYSLICGIILSFKPVKKNSMIALLAMGLAVLSVIPPIDAFTVSRNSQIARLEQILRTEQVLVDNKIVPKADVSLNLRIETTNILNYLDQRNYLSYIKWLPADFKIYDQLQSTFGFEPAYPGINPSMQYFYIALDTEKPMDISGYDIMLNVEAYKGTQTTYDFQIQGVSYRLTVERQSPQEARVSVKDAAGNELIGTGLYDFAASLAKTGNEPKAALPPEAMTLDIAKNGYQLRIVFNNVNLSLGNSDTGADYRFFVLFHPPVK